MIMHLYLLSVICVLATALPMDTSGYPQASADWFQSSHWLDKIPSIEVKVKPDGITVRTGPSQEDIYWIIGYVILGIILFTLFALAIGFCIYCVCWKERQGGSSRVIVREISNNPDSRFSNPFPFTSESKYSN
ncbi:unnamed protein product [Orchesella dallaii]|uniref:Uncharacterized protein n=1 Tax=Orchesella dallaii TaxID=48710 RepID=A0ABP1S277_9HEXA